MTTELTPEVTTLFSSANFVHLATVLPDGGPHTVAVWTDVLDGRIAVFTSPTSRKARNMEADARVALSVVAHDNPYETATVRGRYVERIDGEPALEVMDRISVRYTSEPFPMRSGSLYLIEPERVTYEDLPFEHRPAAS